MRAYSDYNTITRGYLRNYNSFKVTIENLQAEINDLQEELITPASPIAKYGDGVAGAYQELNNIESEVHRRLKIEKKINLLSSNIKSLKKVTGALERIFGVLPNDDLNIIKGYYFERKSWREVADEYYISEKWARQKGLKVVKRISDILFCRQVLPPEQIKLFDFIEIKQLTNN